MAWEEYVGESVREEGRAETGNLYCWEEGKSQKQTFALMQKAD